MSSTPIPPSSPPSPPPGVFNFIKVFPSVEQTTDFAVLGYGNFDSYIPQYTSDGFAVRYDAAAAAYIIDVPAAPPGRFTSTSGDAANWHGFIIDGPHDIDANILKPSNPNLNLVYTTFGDYLQYDFDIPAFDGVFAFGQATPAGAVPTTGSATYSALLRGRTTDWDMVGGTASLTFNFGAGTLAGHLEPVLTGGISIVSLGTYNFVNTIYSAGSTTFSGGLLNSANNMGGSFTGQFTGPQAQELMARWTAQYSGSSGMAEIYGVLVGKKP